ncbi:MAG: hypothetical protein WD825_02540, partial [Gemmatimonadaceae bacterium]
FWWRINAWSEIAAMASSFIIALGFFIAQKNGAAIPAHVSLLLTVAATTVVWVTVTLVTPPTARTTLVSFYTLVRPAGPGWHSVRVESGVGPSPDSLPMSLLGWVLGCTFVYAALFGAGSFLYGRMALAFVWLAIFLVSGIGLLRLLPSLWKGAGQR